MHTVYQPSILKEEFEAFRALLGPDVPNTYDEWLKLAEDDAKEHAGSGDVAVRAVTIHPDEFSAWIATHRDQSNVEALNAIALVKGLRGDRE
jgi:hypothetical protein